MSTQSDALPKNKNPDIARSCHNCLDFPPLYQEGGMFLMRSSWFLLVMSDPELFHSSMAFAAAIYHLVNKGCLSNPTLLSLRQRAISAINKSLSNPTIQPSDQLIGTVLNMCASSRALETHLCTSHCSSVGVLKWNMDRRHFYIPVSSWP